MPVPTPGGSSAAVTAAMASVVRGEVRQKLSDEAAAIRRAEEMGLSRGEDGEYGEYGDHRPGPHNGRWAAGRRQLQAEMTEEQLLLLERSHSELLESEMMLLVPEWQRRLLTPAQLQREGALEMVRDRLVQVYGESQCNATSGCNLVYGACLNTSGLPIYQYDQNGTCLCHPWFKGGDCTEVDLSGDRCLLGRGTHKERWVDPDTCAKLRTRLFLCGSITQSDGMPRRCMDEGLSALECLDAGHIRAKGVVSSSSTGTTGAEDAPVGTAPAQGRGGAGGATRAYTSSWLLQAADHARREACATRMAEDGDSLGGQVGIPDIDCSAYDNGGSQGVLGSVPGFGKARNVNEAARQTETSRYEPNLRGHASDGWAMAVCAKCMGRPETMTKVCRRATSLAECQRMEGPSDQSVCNLCMDDTIGSVMPSQDKGCSLFRGTCSGSVEKRIRGIVPPNVDIIGSTAYGGLRYCAKPGTFSTFEHYFTEDDILLTGQMCGEDHVKRWTGWDWSRQRDHPATVKDELGIKCEDPDNEATCPKARRCIVGSDCHVDQPDWSLDENLQRTWPLGWAEREDGIGLSQVPPWLDPMQNHNWPTLPEGYTWHLETYGWAVRKPDQTDLEALETQSTQTFVLG